MIEPLRKPDMAPVFDALPGNYALLTPTADFFVVAASDSLLRIMGTTRAAVLGHPVFSLFAADVGLALEGGAHTMRRSLEHVLQTLQVDCLPTLRFDLPGADGRGEEHYWEFCNTPVIDQRGTLTGIVLHAENVSRLRRVEQARIADEALHRQILDSARDTGLIGFFEWDVVEAQVFGDERFAAMYDMAPAPAGQGLPLSGLIARVHPDDRQSLRRCLAMALATHADYTREFRVLREDGNVRWVLVRARCYLQQDDKPLRYTGAAIDVSASKLAEAQVRKLNARLAALVKERTSALRMREAQMRAIFETSHQFQGLLSADGILLDANPVSLEAIAAQLPEVVGQPFHDTPWFASSDEVRQVVRTSVSRVATGQAVRRELTLDLPDGTRSFDFAMRPIHGKDAAVVGIIAEATDTTGRRRAEEQLRQSQKMEAIGQLTGGIAHDFNNLLAGIIGSLDLMRHKFNAGHTHDHARHIDMATASAQRAATLTQRLLAFSRRQTLDLKPVNVNELVAGMADLLNRTLSKNVELTFRLASDPWLAYTDANQLENALLNLAINARDAMNDGGKLTITTRNIVLDERYASTRPELNPGAYLMLSVSDTGSGMTPEVIAKAFDPFFTTKPIGQGTGLGLSMIYGYVKQSSGHVTIHSHPGMGSSITLYLPRHGAGAPAVQDEQTVPLLPAGSGQRILVVEDEAAMRAIIVETLTRLGYGTVQASDAAAALAALEAGESPDLLITDVGLPGLNGRQLAEQARRLRPGIRVLFITGYAGPVVRAEFLEEGMDMIAKPFTLDAFAVRVRDMLET